jgi:hypothetical protein
MRMRQIVGCGLGCASFFHIAKTARFSGGKKENRILNGRFDFLHFCLKQFEF